MGVWGYESMGYGRMVIRQPSSIYGNLSEKHLNSTAQVLILIHSSDKNRFYGTYRHATG